MQLGGEKHGRDGGYLQVGYLNVQAGLGLQGAEDDGLGLVHGVAFQTELGPALEQPVQQDHHRLSHYVWSE